MNKYLIRLLRPDKILRSLYSSALDLNRRRIETRWAVEDSTRLGCTDRILFLDLGANLGQAYQWFRRYFSTSNVSFELFEPNPFCYERLLEFEEVKAGAVAVYNVGVGDRVGEFDFYGVDDEQSTYSQGGSIIKEHNSSFFRRSEVPALKVNIINFSDYIELKSKSYDKIVVKMDIEGAEIEVLESMIRSRTINFVDVLYVEFHSHYQSATQACNTRRRELEIIDALNSINGLRVRIWH